MSPSNTLQGRSWKRPFDEIKKSEDRLRLVIRHDPGPGVVQPSDGAAEFLQSTMLDYTGSRWIRRWSGAGPARFILTMSRSFWKRGVAAWVSGMPCEVEGRPSAF